MQSGSLIPTTRYLGLKAKRLNGRLKVELRGVGILAVKTGTTKNDGLEQI